MKVWLLERHYDYEGDQFLGLFWKKEDAKKDPELPADLVWIEDDGNTESTDGDPCYYLSRVEIEGEMP